MDKRVPMRAGILSLVLMALLAAAATVLAAPQSVLSLRVYGNGLVGVNYTMILNDTPSLAIKLTGKPLEDYGILVTDETGTPLPYNFYPGNNTLKIIALGAKEAHISYLTSTLTSKTGETWTLNYTSPFRSRVLLPPGAAATSIAPVPLTANAEDDSLLFVFPAGSVEIQYVIAAPPPSSQPGGSSQGSQQQAGQSQGGQAGGAGKEGTGQGSQPAGGGKTNPPPQAAPSQQGGAAQPLYLIAAGVVVAAAAAASVLVLRRRKLPAENLSEEDAAILRALDSLGGEAFQSDIRRLVDMPTTTLWRHIKKLERLGYVTVEKRYGRNYVKLNI